MSRIAAVQCRVTDLDVRANLARLRRRVSALPDDVALAVLPEHNLTGVAPDRRLREVALDREGPTLAAVRTVAADHGVDVLVGYVERADGNLYDAAAYVTPAATTVYRKRHLWGRERGLLTPGDERIVVETPVGRGCSPATTSTPSPRAPRLPTGASTPSSSARGRRLAATTGGC
jgi:predicted amidohydrolase